MEVFVCMAEATKTPPMRKVTPVAKSAPEKKRFGWGAIVLSVLIFLTLAGIVFVLALNI